MKRSLIVAVGALMLGVMIGGVVVRSGMAAGSADSADLADRVALLEQIVSLQQATIDQLRAAPPPFPTPSPTSPSGTSSSSNSYHVDCSPLGLRGNVEIETAFSPGETKITGAHLTSFTATCTITP